MSSTWMLLLGIEAISIITMFFGVALYRFVIRNHRLFVGSLQHTERQEAKEKIGFLAWFYIIFTLSMTAAITITLFQNSPLV